MRHAIDPKIDCVFKALLGSEQNKNLLMHFLNAILSRELEQPIVWVEIINPYNDKEFLSDKLSIVDVKAKDSLERLYQIEIQLTNYRHLPARIIYNWADIYSQQLQSGADYQQLKPTYAIWLLAENLIAADNDYSHHYRFRDDKGNALAQHGGIWLLELNKFIADPIETEDQRWLQFFKVGEQLNDQALPDWMATTEMRQAMNTLSLFSEKEREYHQYQARQEFLREQRALQMEKEQTAKELEQTETELEQTARALEQTETELEQTAKELEQTTKALEQSTKELEQTNKALDQTTKALDQSTKTLKQTGKELLQAKEREELAMQEREAAMQEKQTALQREEAALAEIKRLKALLPKKD